MTPPRARRGSARPWMKAFCRALESNPSVSAACRRVRISRALAYEWKSRDPLFAELWEEAIHTFYDSLEELLGRRVRRSDRLLIFALKSYLPSKFGDRRETEIQPLLVFDLPVPKLGINPEDAES